MLSSKRLAPAISASTKPIILFTFAAWIAGTWLSHNGLTCFSIPAWYLYKTLRRFCKSSCCSSSVNTFRKKAAILISGLMFSLYHIGYPGFRTFGNILLLFAVGIGFAVAYKLSGNNLIVAYFVNLPNTFVTYILKFEQFPIMKTSSIIAGIITLRIIIVVFILLRASTKTSSKNISTHIK